MFLPDPFVDILQQYSSSSWESVRSWQPSWSATVHEREELKCCACFWQLFWYKFYCAPMTLKGTRDRMRKWSRPCKKCLNSKRKGLRLCFLISLKRDSKHSATSGWKLKAFWVLWQHSEYLGKDGGTRRTLLVHDWRSDKNKSYSAKSWAKTVCDFSIEAEDKIDRLEAFSRRDSWSFSTSCSLAAKTDTCTETLLELLHNTVPKKQWSRHDIVRAHRLGNSINNNGYTKLQPIIAKFVKWSDKMTSWPKASSSWSERVWW